MGGCSGGDNVTTAATLQQGGVLDEAASAHRAPVINTKLKRR
jgi:hypothetical protein